MSSYRGRRLRRTPPSRPGRKRRPLPRPLAACSGSCVVGTSLPLAMNSWRLFGGSAIPYQARTSWAVVESNGGLSSPSRPAHRRDRGDPGPAPVGTRSTSPSSRSAFGAGATAASIVARHIPITSVGVRSQSAFGPVSSERRADLPDALDWSDRSIAIEIGDGGETHAIHVDLLTFEYLMRAGRGAGWSSVLRR